MNFSFKWTKLFFYPFELFLSAGVGASAGEQNRHPLALSLRMTSMKAAVGDPIREMLKNILSSTSQAFSQNEGILKHWHLPDELIGQDADWEKS